MTKEEAIKEMAECQDKMKKLENFIKSNEPEQYAKDWLKQMVEKPFDKVIAKDGTIKYYRNNELLFEQDFKNKFLYVRYSSIWRFLEINYNLEYKKIQAICKDVVGNTLNCEELTPKFNINYDYLRWVIP